MKHSNFILPIALVLLHLFSRGHGHASDPADTPPDNKGASKVDEGEGARLARKWIVRSVTIDGKATPAQIGREVGDVITIKKQGAHLAMS